MRRTIALSYCLQLEDFRRQQTATLQRLQAMKAAALKYVENSPGWSKEARSAAWQAWPTTDVLKEIVTTCHNLRGPGVSGGSLCQHLWAQQCDAWRWEKAEMMEEPLGGLSPQLMVSQREMMTFG